MSGTLNPAQPNGRIAAVSGRNRVIAAVISQVPDAPEAPVLDDQPEDSATLPLPETQERA